MTAFRVENRVRAATMTADVIVVSDLAGLVADPAAGAVATFSGDVRDHDHGRTVNALMYEAHPLAGDLLSEVADEVASQFDVLAVAVMHRVGQLAIGDCALGVAVSSAHRAAAFAACAAMVDQVKARIPVWKHQHFADGTSEWVNCS